jgi:hypothetical protein
MIPLHQRPVCGDDRLLAGGGVDFELAIEIEAGDPFDGAHRSSLMRTCQFGFVETWPPRLFRRRPQADSATKPGSVAFTGVMASRTRLEDSHEPLRGADESPDHASIGSGHDEDGDDRLGSGHVESDDDRDG